VYAVCERYRHVILEVAGDTTPAMSYLQGKYGISIIETPTAAQTENIDAALFFASPVKEVCLPEKCVAVDLCSGLLENVKCAKRAGKITLDIPAEIAAQIPDGYLPVHVLAAALVYGRICIERLRIADIEIIDLNSQP